MAPKRIIRSERYDVPQQFVDLAERRTEFLFRHIQYSNMTMRAVLASAYLQGMSDCANALEARDRLKHIHEGRQDV
ncbi:MAG: hypothetical protein ACOY3N_09585 [Bradyrhizobium sp.]|uniref:hypothetical protein n=1 Tax=Bradyrhizobium sp. TaxID=376 RepID=UPI003BF28F5D